MKNYERYADEIREYKGDNFCKDFVMPNILESDDCGCIDCDACHMLQILWLIEDYEEPETDWSKVEVDTPILVKMDEPFDWERKHFARYEDGKVCTWYGGATSWTATYDDITPWNYAKLAESEEE